MENKTELNWYDLKDKEYFYLKKNILNQLVCEGVDKAGSLSKLCINLKSNYFYTSLRRGKKGISLKTLKKLLNYINMDYNILNNNFAEIRRGNKPSIKNPNFPINLLNINMGSILGHVVSDGCLYYDKSRKNLIRTKYCSPDEQVVVSFIDRINNIFGQVHFNKEIVRNCKIIRIGNGIVGEALRLAGASIGRKYELNNNIPWLIKESRDEIKRGYLSAIFDDEGSVGEKPFPYIILSRNIHIKLTDNEKGFLDKFVVPFMNINFFPTGHKNKTIPIKKLRGILENKRKYILLNKILNHKPKILLDESNLLKNSFDINNSTYIISLQLTHNLNYSVKSCLVIRNKKDVIKFYRDIGFTLYRKQNKLRTALINKGRIKYGS